MNKKLIGSVAVGIALLILGYFGYKISNGSTLGLVESDFAKLQSDVIGTQAVTTTVGVGFSITSTGGQSATSSYVSRIGGKINTAVYTIRATAASSTSNATFDIQGSNDAFCDTTATTGGNLPLASEINWASAGDHLRGKAHATSFSNASSTAGFYWENPAIGNVNGKEIILTDLNYECLKLNVSGSSTVLYVGLRTK